MAKSSGTIATKLELSGEKQYKQAIAEANKSLRMLRQELKTETAQLGANATAQDKARAKSENLKKQIEEQKKVVAQLKAAYEASKTEFAENTELQEKWRLKLLQGEEALANLQNALDDTNDALEDAGGGFEEAADGAEKAATEVVSFKDAVDSTKELASGIKDGFVDAFSSIKESVTAVITEMYSLMAGAAATAGNWSLIQGIYGGTVEDIQKIFKGGAANGIEFDQMATSVQKVVEKVKTGGDEMNEWLEKSHIDPSQMSEWETYLAVMNRLHVLHGEGDDGMAIEIFGGGVDDLKALDKWLEINNAGEEKQSAGLFFDQETVDQLTELQANLTNLSSTWQDLKDKLGAELAMSLNVTGITDDIIAVLQDVAAIFSGSGDSKELKLKLDEDLNTLIADIKSGLSGLSDFMDTLSGDLQESDSQILQFIGKLIDGFSDLLDWIVANGDTIISWLNTLLPVMAGNKVTEAVTGKTIPELIGSAVGTGVNIFTTVKTWTLLGKAAATGFGASSVGATLGSTAASSIGGAAVGTAIGKAAGTALLASAASIGVAIGAAALVMFTPSSAGSDAQDSFYVDENGNVDYTHYKDGSEVTTESFMEKTDDSGWNYVKDANGMPYVDRYGNYTEQGTGDKVSAGIKSGVDLYGDWGAYDRYSQTGMYGGREGIDAAANLWWDMYRSQGWSGATGTAAEELDRLMGSVEWRDLMQGLDTELLDMPDEIVAALEDRLNGAEDTATSTDIDGMKNAVVEAVNDVSSTISNQKTTIYVNIDGKSAGMYEWGGGSLRRTAMTK